MIRSFIEDCQARGLTKHTIETYACNVKTFLRLFNEPVKTDLEGFRSFLAYLRQRDLDGSTIKGYFASVSAFYEYLVFEGYIANNPVTSFRKRYLSRLKMQYNGENSRQLITVQEMQLLISAAGNIRDKAILLTLAKTGMRRGELLALKIDDLDLRRRIIRIPAKAKRSNRLAFMDDEMAFILQEYVKWRNRKAKSSWLWITNAGGRIHKDYPGKILADLGAALDLHDPKGALCNKLTPHCCRHWFTTWLFRAGMNAEYIKFLRGDSLGSQAWQLYNHIDPEAVRQEYLGRIPKILGMKSEVMRGSNNNLNPG